MSQRERSASHLAHATSGPVVQIQTQGPLGSVSSCSFRSPSVPRHSAGPQSQTRPCFPGDPCATHSSSGMRCGGQRTEEGARDPGCVCVWIKGFWGSRFCLKGKKCQRFASCAPILATFMRSGSCFNPCNFFHFDGDINFSLLNLLEGL